MGKNAVRTRRKDETIRYVIEITDWNWNFSFGLNRSKRPNEPYLDFRHLNIVGKLLNPQNVKVNSAKLAMLPDANLNLNRQSAEKLHCVGSLQILHGALKGLMSLPADVLDSVLQMLVANRFHYVVLEGDALRYRQGLVRSYSLEMALGDDELADDQTPLDIAGAQ